MIVNEGLRENDLKYLVSNYISIDQYTSKIDEDNITVAFFCNEKEVAEDLRNFIEKVYVIEIRDVEISDSMTDDNKYILFVEFERNIMFPKIILDVVDSINFLTDNKNWQFKSVNMKDKVSFDENNLKKYVRLTKLRDGEQVDAKANNPVQEAKIVTIKNKWFKQDYLDEGFVSEEQMNKIIKESESFNSRDDLEYELLKENYPYADIITTDDKVFIITDRIQQLGV